MSAAFSILLTDSLRGRAYIQSLCKAGHCPAEVVLMTAGWRGGVAFSNDELKTIGFDPYEAVTDTVARYDLPVIRCDSDDVNSAETIAAVANSFPNLMIFGGPGGQILKKEVLGQGKAFLHAHPGVLPDFRGSTTVYYSILERRRCGVSVIVFNEGIDTGSVVHAREYQAPYGVNVDLLYDPDIRAKTMVEAVALLKVQNGLMSVPQDVQKAPYFVIHPVLKHLALLSVSAWA